MDEEEKESVNQQMGGIDEDVLPPAAEDLGQGSYSPQMGGEMSPLELQGSNYPQQFSSGFQQQPFGQMPGMQGAALRFDPAKTIVLYGHRLGIDVCWLYTIF